MAAALFMAPAANAQVTGYTFATGSDPYVALAGATTFSINGGGGTADDGYSALQPIGFSFNFGGTAFTQFSMHSNGWLRFGATASATDYSPMDNGTMNDLVVFNARDLNNSGAVYSYLLTGSPGSYICKIQANNFYRYNTAAHLGNAQVWLYEATGAIEIRYGTYAATWTSGIAQVGIRTTTTDVRKVVSATWAGVTSGSTDGAGNTAGITQATTNQVVSGTLFTFTPPVVCTGTPDPGTVPSSASACSGNTVTLTATGLTAGTNITYQWEESPDGIGSWADVVVGTGGTTASYTTDAIVGTRYFRIRTDCSTGPNSNNSNVATVSVTTGGIDEDFSSGTIIGNCWSQSGTGSAVNLRYVATSAYGTGTGSIMWDYYSQSGTTLTLIYTSPVITAIGSGMQLEFDVAAPQYNATSIDSIYLEQSSNGGTTWSVVVAGSNEVGSTFNTLPASTTEYNTPASGDWQARAFPLTAGTNRVRFRGVSKFGNNIHIDNIALGAAPTCQAPTAVGASNLTGTTAQIGWTCTSCTGTFIVEYGATGFTPGTAGTAGAGGTIWTGGPVASSPVTITGLTPVTGYTVYVREVCPGPDYSPNSFATNFTTPCATYTPDYTQDFTAYVPSCWSEATGPITGPTTFGSSGWSSGSFGYVGSPSAKVEIYSTGGKEWLLTPIFDLSAGGYELNFDVALTAWLSSSADVIEADDAVYLMQSIDGGTTWTTINTWNNGNSPSNTGDNTTINVSAVTSSTTQFAFFMLEGATSGGDKDFYVDNFQVRTPPACAAPSALTAINATTTGADLGWTENGTATAWDLEIGAAGFTPSGTPTDNVSSNPSTWTGGVASTAYDFYVRADCGGPGVSIWVGPFTFNTTCAAVNVPYTQDFESATTPAMPACMSVEDLNGFNTWITASSTTLGPVSKVARYPYTYSADADDWMYSPGINLVGSTPYTLSYTYGANGYDESLEVYYGTSASAAAMTNLVVDNGTFDDAPHTVSYTITPASTGVYYFGWHAYSISGQWNLEVDNISLIVTPACPDPSALSATSLTSSGANLGWTENGSATAWDLEIGTTGFTPSGTPTDNAGTNPYTWAAGTPNTGYEFYVRADCGMDLSAWVGPYGFTTLAVPPANDNCGGAYGLTVNPDLACGTVTAGTIAAATASPESAAACSGTEDDDVWFSFVATATSHTISIINITGSTTDLYHSVWEGGCGSLTLVPGTCSDPNSSTPSGLSIGNTYFLRVYSWTSTPGQTSSFDVCIGTPPPPPANDLCANAIPVGANSVTPGTTVLGTTTGNPGYCDYSLSTAPGVWYTVQGINGMMTADVCGAGWDTRIGIFTGSCGALTCLQGDDDGCGLQSTTTWLGLIGTTYYIYVTGYSTNTGTFNLTLSSVPGNSVVVAINTDASPSEIGWELTDASNITIATGGPSAISGLDQQTVLLDALPVSACYGFTLTDSYGDGIIGGNWQLKTMDGKVLVGDDFDGGGNSPSLTPAYAPYTEHTFCLPPGPANIANKSCGIFNFSMNSYVYCRNVAGAGNYQFEFSNPDAGYIRRIAVNTNKVRFNQMNTSPLTPGVKYFVRVRTNDAGPLASAHFGAGCEVAISSTVPCTELISAPTYGHSCDENRTFNTNNSFIYATPVVGATEYQFRIFIPSEGYDETFIRSTYILQLKWNNHPPMVNGSTYSVQVNVKVGATYSGFCGNTCTITIDNAPRPDASMEQANGTATMWPNPVRESQVNLSIDGIQDADQQITVDIQDIYGKQVFAKAFGNSGERFTTILDLPGDIASGVYMVNITVNGKKTVQRLSIIK
ncbi:MAG: T9SS type A sorting domain-containing protein [Flavobacteriales bacterium]|nr:T9SS type A sorting domain-containing protein [Flavobacteriales bacterium]